MSAEEKRKRYEKIVKTCYSILAKFSSGIQESDWEEIAAMREHFDMTDPFAKALWFDTYEELTRQYRLQQSA
jgi:hypothetical protein